MEAPGLSFSYSKTGSGGVLRTPSGTIEYLHEECFVYQALFDIIDYDEDGSINLNDAMLLLERSSVAKETIISLWKSVSGRDSCDKLVVEQWLVLCKLVAQTQTFHRTDIESLFELVQLPLMNLHLNEVVSPRDYNGDSHPRATDLQMDVLKWATVNDGLLHHVDYTLQFTQSIPQESEWQVTRRYSDFEFLSTMLRRYRGCLIPPLPPKSMLQSFYQDVAVERSQELGLFLQNLHRHPVLRNAYEIQLFQRASPRGFRIFHDLIVRLDAAVGSSAASSKNTLMRNTDAIGSTSVAGTMTSVASNVTTLAANYAYRMLMSVSNSSAPLTPLAPPPDIELEASIDSLEHSLQCLRAVAAKLCHTLTVERATLYESSRIAYYLEQCAVLEGNRTFDETLIKVFSSLNFLIDCGRERLEPQARDVLYNIQNIARFYDVLRDNRQQRQACVARWNESHALIHVYRKQLDNARTSSGSATALETAREKLASVEAEEEKKEAEVTDMITALKREIVWVESLKKFEIQGRLLGLATMRVALARQNIDTWERLKLELEGTFTSSGGGDDESTQLGSFL